MPSKTNILRVSVGLLFIAMGAICFGADLPKYFNMTETLNAQWNERFVASVKAPEVLVAFKPMKSRFWSSNCSGIIHGWGECMILPEPSKFRILESENLINNAFLGCTNFHILNISLKQPSPPIIVDPSFYDGCLVLKRTETSDVFAMRMVYWWLVNALKPNYWGELFNAGSADAEMTDYKQTAHFTPNIVFVFEGKDGLQVELDTRKLSAVIRTKDRWGCFTLDKLSAEEIEARVEDLHELYTSISEE